MEATPQAPIPSFTCVGGMLRVLTDIAEDTSMEPSLASPGQSNDHPQVTTEPSVLTQKQIRELRRLCRKTANRAEFDDRLIQVRQIASIAAMGTPSAHFFDPNNEGSGRALREWVDLQRAQGADWRDERPLPDDAIDELRRWDRALKAWARLRFDTSPSRSSLGPHMALGSAPSTLAGRGKASSPITPHIWKRRQSTSEFAQFSSPVSPDTALFVSSPLEAAAASKPKAPERATLQEPHRMTKSSDKRQPLSEVSISRVGDTINITVPTLPMANVTASNDKVDTHGCNIARDDQENQYPPMTRRPSYIHAVNTAKSWRNTSSGATQSENPPKSDKEVAYRTAAKTLFSGPPKDATTAPTSGAAIHLTQRSAMDWGKLRRPVLRTLSLNNNAGNQSLPNTSK